MSDGLIIMSPRMVLLLLFILVIAANVITLMVRKKKFLELEGRVFDLARSKNSALTLEEISTELGVSVHDTKILMRKSVARGNTKVETKDGKKVYTVQKVVE